MASQGPNNPTAAAIDATGVLTWSNPTNVFSSNNTYASASKFLGTSDTHGLKATGFGFTIPGGSTINGIVLEFERTVDSTGLIPDEDMVNDSVIKLVKAGSPVGSNLRQVGIPWLTSEVYQSYGGASNLWGTTWAVAEINAADFGCSIVAEIHSTVGNTSARIDHIRLTVHYTAGGGGGASEAQMFAMF